MSSTPPTGTVTFLFTDVEGSTALWENHPTRMPRVIERHDRILREAVEAHDGYVFKTVGDACHSVFDRPREALRAALSAQRALFTENWGGAIRSLRVRMALHTGSAEQEREGDYFGPAVNRVARLLGPAHGGQVLLSSATYGQVYDHPELVDEEARFVSLGEHRLKDLTHPELVYQLTVPDLPERFPPLRTQENPEEDDRYRIKDFLGSGGMAKVYMAHDEKLDRDVAMKVLQPRYGEDEELVQRFEREARSTARLSHPNIVPAYDRGQKEDGSYYMVMEYLPGGTLKDLIVREGPLSPHTAVELALQIARALEAAHQEGIVHRDIKPQNVLLSQRGEAKVTDFGICRAVSESTLTRVGLMVGTPHYMSPELAEGQRADFRSDLYSLGVILYEMLTGELPFDAETPAAIISQQLRGQVSPPREINPEVPERVEAVVMRLLARDPEDRYPDATALIDDLRQVSRSLEVQGEDNGGLVRPPSRAATTQKKEVFAGTVVGDAKAPSLVEVPNLVGKDVFMANSVLGNGGLTLGDQKEVPSETIPEGEVTEQTPAAGTKVEPGCMVSVTISSGPPTVEVPDLAGLNRSEASSTLAAAGLKLGEHNEVRSETVSEGRIVEQNPEAGAKAKRGSSVSIAVSMGPSTVVVPNLSEQKPRQARKKLAAVGLELGEQNRAPNDEVPEGEIVGQDPVAGTKAEWGRSVSVTLSSGPKKKATVAVPDVSGRSIEEVRQVLESAGLVLAVSRTKQSREPAGTVISTDPSVGSQVDVGSSVTPIVSSGLGSGSRRPSAKGEQDKQAPPPRTTSPASSPTHRQSKEKQRRIRPSRGLIVVAILVLAILVPVAVRLTLSASSSSTPTDTVPDLQGKTISEAAKAAGEEVVVTPYFFNGEPVRASKQPKGTIIDQIPKPGQSSSGPIFVELSGGQEKVKVPDVSGMYSPQAGKVLIDAGLAPDFDVAFDGNGNSRVFTNANKNDEKIGVTDPPSGEVVDAGTHIVALGEK